MSSKRLIAPIPYPWFLEETTTIQNPKALKWGPIHSGNKILAKWLHKQNRKLSLCKVYREVIGQVSATYFKLFDKKVLYTWHQGAQLSRMAWTVILDLA